MSAITPATITRFLLLCGATLPFPLQFAEAADAPIKVMSPADGATIDTFLTAVLRWEYPMRATAPFPFLKSRLEVSPKPDLSSPFVNEILGDHQTTYRLALAPQTTYYWRVTPLEIADGKEKAFPELASTARFTTGKTVNQSNADDHARYSHPREGAHWQYMTPTQFEGTEPLAPWFDAKSYKDAPPPPLDAIRSRFPVPVWDGHPEALDAWWYCWKTILSVWCYGPETADHQAVANLIGYRTWGPWGSTMVWDTCFMLHFARYGAQAYPFITGLDNCYARQHENGFICRESDRNNREVYVGFPTNPPLFAWAEWEWYKITGDKQRLSRVLLPIVKHYEWWMKYQRRNDGLYWTQGMNEADDSPRNAVMHYAVSATSYQGLAALCISQMAAVLGRDDLKAFFDAQHSELKELLNANFWDAQHEIYNDLDKDRRFITELNPGELCKHVHMFWPLMAGLTTPERAKGMVKELKNPASFNRRNGIPSLSADSKGYNKDNGQYWLGAVWPPTQCMVQEGLESVGERAFAQEIAEKYYKVCIETFVQDKTMKENHAPDKPLSCGAPEFVGWAGIGPVANLIEYVFGLDINAPKNTITWRVKLTERHGLQNLQFGNFKVNLICEPRPTPNAPCRIKVNSSGAFTLKIEVNGKTSEYSIVQGERGIEIP